ncbi:cytochrome c [Bacteroidota bacterium]
MHKREKPKREFAKTFDDPYDIPEFKSEENEYVLLAWNDLGMHCISDNDKFFSFLPPANTLWAQLVKRGENPKIINKDIIIEYQAQDGYQNPQKHVDFWKYAKTVYGADLEEGVGLAGNKVNGVMDTTINQAFVAHFIPVTPYKDDGTYNPFPLFTVMAKDKNSGEVLARTKVVVPTSTEMGCRNCHNGGWRVNNNSGIADETAINILKTHDRINNTDLLDKALNGEPQLCQSCHMDPAIGAPGKEGILNFSTAMHGFHANMLTNMNDDACNLCHPSNPMGNTSCLRGRHKQMGQNCTNCHGKIEDHALSLLANEIKEEKDAAELLKMHLNPRFAKTKEEINPRIPWMIEPDCLSCHEDFNIKQFEETPIAFNKWVPEFDSLYRNRTDHTGMMCSACHGSTHAIYFATNKYGIDRDNIQPIIYQGLSGSIGTNMNCKVCHTKGVNKIGHHKNIISKNPVYRKPIKQKTL